jgi:uridine kinase
MKGDILIIGEHHRKAAKKAVALLLPEIKETINKYVITVAGESGAGKSEIAASIADELDRRNFKCFVFQQDDYFVYPPKTNASKREENIKWVGMQEVKLDLLDKELAMIKNGIENITKPLVIFDEDRIDSEEVNFKDIDILIAEGTFTTALKTVDCKVFIDRDINDTREARKKRAREKQDEFLEKILTIEHEIISKHKEMADIVITKEYDAVRME